MKALRLDIFKHKGENCSNHGISSRFNEILLICDEGYIDIDENDMPENTCKLVECNICGTVYKHIEPAVKCKGCGWMAGGTVVYSCDSRFRKMSEYPLILHDRSESQQEYDTYSR